MRTDIELKKKQLIEIEQKIVRINGGSASISDDDDEDEETAGNSIN